MKRLWHLITVRVLKRKRRKKTPEEWRYIVQHHSTRFTEYLYEVLKDPEEADDYLRASLDECKTHDDYNTLLMEIGDYIGAAGSFRELRRRISILQPWYDEAMKRYLALGRPKPKRKAD